MAAGEAPIRAAVVVGVAPVSSLTAHRLVADPILIDFPVTVVVGTVTHLSGGHTGAAGIEPRGDVAEVGGEGAVHSGVADIVAGVTRIVTASTGELTDDLTGAVEHR